MTTWAMATRILDGSGAVCNIAPVGRKGGTAVAIEGPIAANRGENLPHPAARDPLTRPIPAFATTPRARGLGLRASAASALDRRRLFILFPFAAIAGLVAFLLVPVEPDSSTLIALGSGLIGGLLLSLRSALALRAALLANAFFVGICLLPVHGALFGTAMLSRPTFGTYSVRIDQILSQSSAEVRVLVSSIEPQGDARALPVRRARLFIRGQETLAPGDVIRLPVRFYPVPGPVLPGAFDAQFHGYFDGIGAYGAATGAPEPVSVGFASAPERLIDWIRRTIATRIDQHLAQPSAGIVRAIVNGDQSGVRDDARAVMAQAGLAHVLSISGLHLTLVAGGVVAALRLLMSLSETLSRYLPIKQVAAGAGILAALSYFAISGGNVAALRATIMIVLVLGAVLAGRQAITMRNVAIAALIVVLSDPAGVFRPSFQLSFAAVVGLVGAFEAARQRTGGPHGPFRRAGRYFGGLAATSLIAGAATLLFSAYHFQQTSPLGVLGNLAALPLVGFVMMPAVLLAVLAMPFGLEGPFLGVAGWSVERMLGIARLVADLGAGLGGHPLLTPLSLVIGLLALGWFAFFTDRWRLLGPALALPAVLLFTLDRPPDVLVADTTQAGGYPRAGWSSTDHGQTQDLRRQCLDGNLWRADR